MAAKLHISEVGRVVVPATDQEAALEFYTGKLGFEVRADVTFDDGNMRWIEVAPPGGGTGIALFPPMEGEPKSRATGIILSSSDIDADHAALREAGVDVDPEVSRMEPPVPPMFTLRDPAGNRLAVVEPLES